MKKILKIIVFAIISCLASTAESIIHHEHPIEEQPYTNMLDQLFAEAENSFLSINQYLDDDLLDGFKDRLTQTIFIIEGLLVISQETKTYYKNKFQTLLDQASNLV